MSSPTAADQESRRGLVRAWLTWLNGRTAELVAELRSHHPVEVDALRGVYLDERDVRSILSAPDPSVGNGPANEIPLDHVADRLGLDVVDAGVLLVAASPDLDQRYEQIFGYLNDDVTRRRATPGLCLRLVGLPLLDPASRRRLLPGAPLVDSGMVRVEESERSLLSRTLRVPDRVATFLLGDDSPDVRVRVGTVCSGDRPAGSIGHTLATALELGVEFIYLRDSIEGTAAWHAEDALSRHEGCIVAALPDDPAAATETLDAARLDALLLGVGLAVGPVEHLGSRTSAGVSRLAALPRPVILTGRRAWDTSWTSRTPLVADATPLDDMTKDALWRSAFDGADDAECDPVRLCAALRLGPDHIRRAGETARLAATIRGEPVRNEDVLRGARSQYSSSLQRLTNRIDPSANWSDLVLPSGSSSALRELTSRVRHRRRVLDDWGLRRGGGRGDGLAVMFAGPSGTGKTLAAEVVAHDLGLTMHTVDVSTVVDKYIGETEKHLEQVFDEAERLNTVLFFDEADALFGKRSEVRDARDRYANVEVAYLLQRMERFDGIVVLATNLKLNIDDAFARRLDVVVEFPRPDSVRRARLWEVLIGPAVPLDASVDIDYLASHFEMAGGDIRNAVTTAAYLAADRGDVVTMADLIRGVGREYRKLGRLCLPHDFGEWTTLVELDGDPPDPLDAPRERARSGAIR